MALAGCSSASSQGAIAPSDADQPPTDAVAITEGAAAPTEAGGSPPVVHTTTGVPYQMLDLGAASDVFCAVQSVSGLMHGYCTPAITATPMACDPTANSAVGMTNAALATGFMLTVNDAGHWQLATEGQPFGVTVGCIPWHSLGAQSPNAVTIDASAAPDSTMPALMTGSGSSPIQGTCVLSSATDSYDRGASAQLTNSALVVRGPAFLRASATCVNALQPADFPVGTQLPPNSFCGLSQLGDMSQTDSAVSVAGSTVTAVHAQVTARCFPTQ